MSEYTWHEGTATVFATASIGSAFVGLAFDDLVLARLALAFLALAALSFVSPWIFRPLRPVTPWLRVSLTTGRDRLLRAMRERRHRIRLVRILAVSHPGTRIALVSQPLDHAVGAVLLHRLTLHHIRPTTTHVGLYATAPWRRVVAVYEVKSIEAVEDGYLVRLGQGGELVEPLPLAVACGLAHPPTPVRYLRSEHATTLSGALMRATLERTS